MGWIKWKIDQKPSIKQTYKFINEVTLLNQKFVIDPDKTVNEVLIENNVKILDYVRFEVGEGIEKTSEDFADEVMKTISN